MGKKKKFKGASASEDMTGYAAWQKKNWPPSVNDEEKKPGLNLPKV